MPAGDPLQFECFREIKIDYTAVCNLLSLKIARFKYIFFIADCGCRFVFAIHHLEITTKKNNVSSEEAWGVSCARLDVLSRFTMRGRELMTTY